MKDLEKMISGLNKSGFLSGMAGGALGGTVTSMLVGKKSKKYGKTALKAGALAAVGGLAWKAYQSYNQNKQATQSQPTKAAPAENNRFDYRHMMPKQEERFVEIVQDEESDSGQMLLMRAMIAAAYADGHIDANEQQRIFAQVENLDLSTAEKASLFDELRNPLSLEHLVAKVPDAETGAEVYAASLLAIDERQVASQQYLQQLSTLLCIPIELKAMLEQQAGQAKLTA
ncbi:MAG: DUF533 domain-containing protein [Alteromonadaceae bacterium]|nr:DUF533 domain-containing protein [Alteromonadaceae bacterium]